MQEFIPLSEISELEKSYSPLEKVLKDEMNSKAVDFLLSLLPIREYTVIIKRFGLHGEKEHTLEEVALNITNLQNGKIGVTRELARSIEARGLRRIRMQIKQREEFNL